jgi:ParB-like chromosome segregation protein Spo0J
MANGIHESLISLAVDIDSLSPLDGNPRRGDVNAIMLSYKEFGQVKPIVIRPNMDGTSTVIAGNHQLEAAKILGWDKIAAVKYEVSDQTAIAFALTDNRTMELGYTEPELLDAVVVELVDLYPELMEGLGWDEFTAAEIEQKIVRQDNRVVEPGAGFMPPVITNSGSNGFEQPSSRVSSYEEYEEQEEGSAGNLHKEPSIDRGAVSITRDSSGNQQINVRDGVDQHDAVIRGSTTVTPGSSPQAVVQYTIVFDNTQQQARWYEFIKWLRSDPAVAGTTTAEKIIDFIDQHIEI